MKSLNVIMLFFLCGLYSLPAGPQEFVIEKKPATKKMSVAALKEHIGSTTKETIDATIALTKEIGILQSCLAHMQREAACDKTVTALKDMLITSSNILERISLLQHEVVFLQNKCSTVVAKLIDNEHPFKKASKKDLQATLSNLTALATTIRSCTATIQQSHTHMNACKKDKKRPLLVAQQEEKQLHKYTELLKKEQVVFSTDMCLKHV